LLGWPLGQIYSFNVICQNFKLFFLELVVKLKSKQKGFIPFVVIVALVVSALVGGYAGYLKLLPLPLVELALGCLLVMVQQDVTQQMSS
jgi:hypothetical protein